MRELETLIPTLQPPHGGLQQLQIRIASEVERHAPPHRAFVWGTAMALPLLILVLVLAPHLKPKPSNGPLAMAVQQLMQSDLPSNGIHIDHGAALELPSGQANVRLYLVETNASHSTKSEQQM